MATDTRRLLGAGPTSAIIASLIVRSLSLAAAMAIAMLLAAALLSVQ